MVAQLCLGHSTPGGISVLAKTIFADYSSWWPSMNARGHMVCSARSPSAVKTANGRGRAALSVEPGRHKAAQLRRL